jgi:hypothetical protein
MRNRMLAVSSMVIAVSTVGCAFAGELVCPRPILDKQAFEELITDPQASKAERAWWQSLQQQSYSAWAQCQTEHMRYETGSAPYPVDRDNLSNEAQPQSASAELPAPPSMDKTTSTFQPRSRSAALPPTSSVSMSMKTSSLVGK